MDSGKLNQNLRADGCSSNENDSDYIKLVIKLVKILVWHDNDYIFLHIPLNLWLSPNQGICCVFFLFYWFWWGLNDSMGARFAIAFHICRFLQGREEQVITWDQVARL